MGRLLISVFLLSISALSSCNIIPLIALHQKSASEIGQIFENTSNMRDNRAASNPCASKTNQFTELCNLIKRRGDEPDGTVIGITDPINKGNNMDKWHSYPRQFDDQINYGEAHNSDAMNRFLQNFSDQDEDRYQPLETADPNNERNNNVNANYERPHDINLKPMTRRTAIILGPEKNYQDDLSRDAIDDNDLKTAIYMLEIRKNAADKSESENLSESESPETPRKVDLKTVVKKRYISLWSRLQAMSPPNRAQELPHRRHLHLFYHHLPEDIEGRPIPEDPRALFKRPPGSPLRWG